MHLCVKRLEDPFVKGNSIDNASLGVRDPLSRVSGSNVCLLFALESLSSRRSSFFFVPSDVLLDTFVSSGSILCEFRDSLEI